MRSFTNHESDLKEISKIKATLACETESQIQNRIETFVSDFPMKEALQIKLFQFLLQKMKIEKKEKINIISLISFQNELIPNPEEMTPEEITKAWNEFCTDNFTKSLSVTFEGIGSFSPIVGENVK